MAVQFGTEEWVQALMTEINKSAGYKDAAKNWEGDFYFIVTKGAGVPEDIFLYMDLWHGECRSANKMSDRNQKSPEFELTAPLDVWKKVLTKKIDPIRGLMSGQLKLKGPMMKVMKAPKAAIELVECGTRIDTSWPQ